MSGFPEFGELEYIGQRVVLHGGDDHAGFDSPEGLIFVGEVDIFECLEFFELFGVDSADTFFEAVCDPFLVVWEVFKGEVGAERGVSDEGWGDMVWDFVKNADIKFHRCL